MNTIVYNASKGGVIAFTRDLACKWARHGIRVNAIAPGWFPSDMSGYVLERHEETLEQHIPLGRFGGPHDLEGAVVFLASDASAYVTGHTLVVDGGRIGLVAAVPWAAELEERLGRRVESMHLLAGGASKEAWAVDAARARRLLVRRAARRRHPRGDAVARAGVPGTRGRRGSRGSRAEAGGLPRRARRPRGVRDGARRGRDDRQADRAQPAAGAGRRSSPTSLPRSTRSRPSGCPFLRGGDILERFYRELDSVGDPHPAIEYGLWWLTRAPARAARGRGHARRLPDRQRRRVRARPRVPARLGVRPPLRPARGPRLADRARLALRRRRAPPRRGRRARALPRRATPS